MELNEALCIHRREPARGAHPGRPDARAAGPAAELSTAHLSRLESGDRQPSVAALIALSRALGVSLSTLLGERRGAPAISMYPRGRPTHEANGLTIAACSGFPGSTTLEALHITISPDREPPGAGTSPGRGVDLRGVGVLRLEFDGQIHLPRGRASRRTSTPTARIGSAPRAVTAEVLVVAADAPNDFRNHPLFTASITDH